MAKIEKPKATPKKADKPSDSERHKRFVDMAHEVEASEKSEDFERAFKKVVSRKPETSRS